MDYGLELRQWRAMARLTLTQAGDLLIVSPSKISKVERGKLGIHVDEYFRWINLYRNVQHVGTFTFDRGLPAASRR